MKKSISSHTKEEEREILSRRGISSKSELNIFDRTELAVAAHQEAIAEDYDYNSLQPHGKKGKKYTIMGMK